MKKIYKGKIILTEEELKMITDFFNKKDSFNSCNPIKKDILLNGIIKANIEFFLNVLT